MVLTVAVAVALMSVVIAAVTMVGEHQRLDCLNTATQDTCGDPALRYLETFKPKIEDARDALVVVSLPIYGAAVKAGLPDGATARLDAALELVQVTDSNAECVLDEAKKFARGTARNTSLGVVGESFVEFAGGVEALRQPVAALLPVYDQYDAAGDALSRGMAAGEVDRLVLWSATTYVECS